MFRTSPCWPRDTRTVSAKIEVDDKVATEREREKARVQTRRVYVADAAVRNCVSRKLRSHGANDNNKPDKKNANIEVVSMNLLSLKRSYYEIKRSYN